MSKLSAFFKQNKKQEVAHLVKLDSFDTDIRLRIISGAENKRIQKESMTERTVKRRVTKEMDATLYNEKLAIASIEFPNLNDKDLQESYGAHGASELYNAMFNWAEQALIVEAILDISGFNQDINAKINEAKN